MTVKRSIPIPLDRSYWAYLQLLPFYIRFPLSFFGNFFVALNQKKSDKWFLGFPLPIVLLN